MHSKEEDMVTISSSTDKTFKKYLSTKAPVDGYSIASIEWSDKVGATKVTISKDGSDRRRLVLMKRSCVSRPWRSNPSSASAQAAEGAGCGSGGCFCARGNTTGRAAE